MIEYREIGVYKWERDQEMEGKVRKREEMIKTQTNKNPPATKTSKQMTF